jgi:3-oxoacyl-(acyl-carrier-protein) synthase
VLEDVKVYATAPGGVRVTVPLIRQGAYDIQDIQARLRQAGVTAEDMPFVVFSPAVPQAALRCMSSSASASVANLFGILGPSYSIGAASATSAHNIGHAYSLVRSGVADVALAGGGDEVNELVAACFEGMRTALSTRHNDRPEAASRPFDKSRDGFVLSGGGIVVLEAWEHAVARGARVRSEMVGYGSTSNGHAPSMI